MTIVEEETAVSSEPSELVNEFLEEQIESDDYGDPSLNNYLAMSLEDIYEYHLETILDTETKEEQEVFDWNGYVTDLEAIIWGLVNQRALLVNILHRVQESSYSTKDSKDPFSVIGLETLKKMMLYTLTGSDYASSVHSSKFYQTDQFHAACAVHALLPPEWQPRAAKFIELYASRYYETEFVKTAAS